jgi:uncharacterized iron-regulated protein
MEMFKNKPQNKLDKSVKQKHPVTITLYAKAAWNE